jgi:hypothetical protein
VAFHRRIDEPEPAERPAGSYEVRRAHSARVATGTLACPRCDAPVALAGAVTPAAALDCPFCRHAGAAREFLSLGEPTRPQRVVVRVARRR